MATDAIEDDLAKRFRIDPPPTLLARKSSKARIGFSRMRSTRPLDGRSLASPPEEAFAFHVPCIPRSAIVAIFLEFMDGRTAQRSARSASRRCTDG
jgi:hypothetical protein